jgi:ABC-2 type transport system ATP-binding protein
MSYSEASINMIVVQGLTKEYQVARKQPGLGGALQHFWRRDYRTVTAVDGVSFAIAPGEVVGFLGANGAGKTTTLKMLAGLIHPTAGSVTVAGFEPFQRQAAFLRQISLVMGQKQQLLWDLPAMDSLRINGADQWGGVWAKRSRVAIAD